MDRWQLMRIYLHDRPNSNVFFKMGHPRSLFRLFSSIQTNVTILQQINVKNIHPVYGAGIRTHDLWNMSLLP